MQTNRFQLPAEKMQNLVTLANSGKRKAALKEAKQFEKSYPRDPALKNFSGVIYASEVFFVLDIARITDVIFS